MMENTTIYSTIHILIIYVALGHRKKCEDFIGGLTKFLLQSPDPARLWLWQERERGRREELAENEKLSQFQWFSMDQLNSLWKWIEQSSEIYIERGTQRETTEKKEEGWNCSKERLNRRWKRIGGEGGDAQCPISSLLPHPLPQGDTNTSTHVKFKHEISPSSSLPPHNHPYIAQIDDHCNVILISVYWLPSIFKTKGHWTVI